MSKTQEYLLRSFELAEEENIIRGKGPYLYTKKDKYFDTTSGLTGTAILGWSNKKVVSAIEKQLKKFTHVDFKVWSDENLEKLFIGVWNDDEIRLISNMLRLSETNELEKKSYISAIESILSTKEKLINKIIENANKIL